MIESFSGGNTLLPAFTYFEDVNGHVYYARFPQEVDGVDGYSAVSVYYPNPPTEDTDTRISVFNGNAYGKFATGGLDYEIEHLRANAPDDVAEYILSKSVHGDIDEPQFLFVASTEIDTVFNARDTLVACLDGTSKLPHANIEAVQRSVLRLAEFDIPPDALSLYGSMLCGIVKPKGHIKDVDLLINGFEYYDNLLEVAKKYPAPEIDLPKTVAVDDTRSRVVQRRRQIAQFAVDKKGGIHCDVRIAPRKTDNVIDLSQFRGMSTKPREVSGKAIVLDASASLSLPFRYVVATNEQHASPVTQVVGGAYRSLGAASHGEYVEYTGLQLDKSTVLLSNHNTHTIYPVAS